MSKTARVPEPSMEEILASIRRIIADDSGTAGQPGANTAPAATDHSSQMAGSEMAQGPDAFTSSDENTAESDFLELSRPVEPGDSPAFTPIRGPDVVFRAEEPPSRAARPAAATAATVATVAAAAPQPRPSSAPVPAPAPPAALAPAEDRLLSPNSTAAVSAAFNSLASTVLSENARTLEDLVKDMMRPMLKDWLDENLPGLVERIVRAEIERVSRGGR
jgi:uncharacterized protein